MNLSTNQQRISQVLAAAGIAALAGGSVAVATGPSAPSQPGQPGISSPSQHQHPQHWMQPDTRDRDRDRDKERETDRDKDKDHDKDKYRDKDRDKDAERRIEAKPIDMARVTTADEVLGAEVISSTTNESLGSASDLIISVTSGDIEWFILDKGAVFDDLVAINMEQVSWDHARERFTTSITEARLEYMPTFEADDWANLRHEDWYGALENLVTGDERDTLGTIKHVRASDIIGQPLLANLAVPEDPNVDTELDGDGTDIERAHVADVHDIVLAMDIERAPVLIARSGGLLDDTVDRAVPINAVRWSQRDPILMNVTEALYEAIVRLPENYPREAHHRAGDMVHAFRSFKMPALIKEGSASPRTPDTPDRPRW